MAKFRARIDGLEGGSHEELKTPPAARQAAPKDVASVPKLKKEVQSRRILDEGNGVKDASASTSARAAAPKAVKAKAKPPGKGKADDAQPKKVAKPTKPAKVAVKEDLNKSKSSTEVAKAVKQSLARGVTGDMEDDGGAKLLKAKTKAKPAPTLKKDVPAKPAGESKTAKKDAECGSDDVSDDPQADPEAAEKVRLKKAHHARFMRFSRSLKSTLVEHVWS